MVGTDIQRAGKGKKVFIGDAWMEERGRHNLVIFKTEVTERWVFNGGENGG